MLSIESSTNGAWRSQFLTILSQGHDVDNDAEVFAAFNAAFAWARKEGFPCDKPAEQCAKTYLNTKRDGGTPIIPRFMRAYCAHLNKLQCIEHQPRQEPSPSICKEAAKEAASLPPRMFRHSPAMART
jgi:hypothetical protein